MLFFRNQHILVDETFLNNMEDVEKSYSVSTTNYTQKSTHDLQLGKNQGCCSSIIKFSEIFYDNYYVATDRGRADESFDVIFIYIIFFCKQNIC